MRVLEDQVGVKLFYRSFNGIIPTEAGEKFYLFSKNTLSELNNLIQSEEICLRKILISEILFSVDINNNKKFNIEESKIDVKKTCDIPKFAETNIYDDIICFQKLDNLRNYFFEEKNMQVTFMCSKDLLERKNFFIVNKDKYCLLRKKA